MDINRHLDVEEIERHSLDQTPDSDLERVECHLLLCPLCRQRVESSDVYVHSMQLAAAEVRREPQGRGPALTRVFLVLAAAAVLLLAVPLVVKKTPPPFAVTLAATRGSAAEGKAPAGVPLALQFDLTGVPPAASYKLQMVNRTGQTVWTGVFPGATVPPVGAGTYYVRLYAPTGDLLREFGLEIEPR